jgi:recombination protein RecT
LDGRAGGAGSDVAVYAVAHLKGGGIQVEVMPKAEVDQHRARSRAGQSGPWVTDYEAMALKTVVRKIFKYLPKAGEIHEAISRAIQLDERADRGEAQYAETDLTGMQVFDEGPSPVSATPQPKPKALDALKGAPAAKVTRNDVPVAQTDAEEEVSTWVLSDEDKRLDAEIAAREADAQKK